MPHVWRFPCSYVDNYDGDTVDLSLDLGFRLRYSASVRLNGVDTPELRGKDKMLKAAGFYARDEVRQLLSNAGELIFVCERWSGKYGRPIGDVEVDGVSLRQYIIDNRMGAPYDGGSRNALLAAHLANAQWLRDGGMLEGYLGG